MAADRIPPRADTDVPVSISGWSIPMAPVTLSIDGAGGGNGSVTVNGVATASLTASATVKLRGATQTAPGNAGNLTLVATQGGTELARSAGFSVAAIPRNVTISHRSAINTATRRGMVVNTSLESDSGTVADLDRAEFSEQVQYGSGSGVFAGITGANSGYLPANGTGYTDTHGAPVSRITGDGAITAEQTFIFKDDRTSVTDVPMTNSGFRIRRIATAIPLTSTVVFLTSKSGAATTANGYSSSAGSGSAREVQTVP
ncbi:hypothetical protein [Salinigranum salinum]|uniref:hypothetical protein n=1 Tax=Salinigranum salinum TaxID=1364937 RepID=UPI00126121EC|nr:hypothetical protein [Salinigranum salinum]